MSEKQQYLRKLVQVTVADRYKVIRHLECGHTHTFEALCGEAEKLAADARKLIGTKDYCSQCAAEQEQQG
jgi:hypothetical protein